MCVASNPDDTELYARVIALIAEGRLPTGDPAALWGGSGRDQICTVCQQSVRRDEVGIDVMFRVREGEFELHMHSRCRNVWEQARQP